MDSNKKPLHSPFKDPKNLLLLLAVVVICIVALELLTPLVFKTFSGTRFSRAEVKERLVYREGVREGEFKADQEGWISKWILHPYLGYVDDYSKNVGHNRFGFIGPEPFIKRAPGTVIVAITGGSFAKQFYSASRETLVKRLNSIPALSGKKIEVLCLALNGYKQPQQLMALSYFLSLGAEFDILINIDGFNEVALPYSENVPDGIYPFYPRLWRIHSLKRLRLESVALMGRLEVIRNEQQSRKRLFSRWPLRSSNFMLALWDRLDNKNVVAKAALQKEIADSLSQKNPSHQITGPFTPYPNDDALFSDLVRVWKHSSIQLKRLSSANSISYYQFLQPNQNVANSKPFSKEEHIVAFKGGDPLYKAGARKGYGLLIEGGKELSKELSFTDLTMLFKEEERILYDDNCCHLNDLGYDLIADRIAQVIAKDLSIGR